MTLRRKLARAFAEAEVANGKKVHRLEASSNLVAQMSLEMPDVYFPNYATDSWHADGRLWGADVWISSTLADNQVILEC